MIRIKNLKKQYGDTVILEGFNYQFNAQGITCVLGPSGCGKSTLFNLIAGFDRAYKGKISVGDCDISKLSEKEIAIYRRMQIGFVFQEYNLIQGYTVLENILLAAELNESSHNEKVLQAQTLLQKLGMAAKCNEKIENLSGGQKQRVAIARALINDPQMILADEPTGALDRETANEIMSLFSEIAKTKPVIMITHDEKICQYSDTIITISEGKEKILKEELPYKQKPQTELSFKVGESKLARMRKRAIKNFRTQLGKFMGIALATSIGVSAVLFAFSSGNVITHKIQDFEEKNIAYSYGQISLGEQEAPQETEKLLKENKDISTYYLQYTLPESRITFEGKTVDFNAKGFGSVANEVMNIGGMPQKDEIAITPSVAKKLSNDIQGLIGESIRFSCQGLTKELTISGIFNHEFDDFYLGEEVEKELYKELSLENPISMAYKVAAFEKIKNVESYLNEQGIYPLTAMKQVESFLGTFKELNTLFLIISIFIGGIALFVCVMILLKIIHMRQKEIGIMMAIGYERTSIRQMLTYESILVSFIAGSMTILIMNVAMLGAKLVSSTLILSTTNIGYAIIVTIGVIWMLTLYASDKLLKTDPAKILKK